MATEPDQIPPELQLQELAPEPEETDEQPIVEVPAPAEIPTETPTEPLAPESYQPPIPQGLTNSQLLRLQQLEQENQQHEAARQRLQEAEALRQYQEALITQHGFTDEQAAMVAGQINQERHKRVQVERQALTHQEFIQGQLNAAVYYGKQYGVNPTDLLVHQTPETMEAAAKQQKDNTQLRDRLARLEKAQSPTGQTFEMGQGGNPANSAARRAALRNKSESWTDAEFAEMGRHLNGS